MTPSGIFCLATLPVMMWATLLFVALSRSKFAAKEPAALFGNLDFASVIAE
jgi:hypothetical protein